MGDFRIEGRRKERYRRVARVVVPLGLLASVPVWAYLMLLFAWLSATPGDPEPRKTAATLFCAAIPVSLALIPVSLYLLRPRFGRREEQFKPGRVTRPPHSL